MWFCSRTCGVIFFFSSRRRHTRCSRDWSSDVCSSDLLPQRVRVFPDLLMAQGSHKAAVEAGERLLELDGKDTDALRQTALALERLGRGSEEGRGGEEGRSRWAPYHLKKKKRARDDVLD